MPTLSPLRPVISRPPGLDPARGTIPNSCTATVPPASHSWPSSTTAVAVRPSDQRPPPTERRGLDRHGAGPAHLVQILIGQLDAGHGKKHQSALHHQPEHLDGEHPSVTLRRPAGLTLHAADSRAADDAIMIFRIYRPRSGLPNGRPARPVIAVTPWLTKE